MSKNGLFDAILTNLELAVSIAFAIGKQFGL